MPRYISHKHAFNQRFRVLHGLQGDHVALRSALPLGLNEFAPINVYQGIGAIRFNTRRASSCQNRRARHPVSESAASKLPRFS